MSDTEMALDYYRACFRDERPNYVPARILTGPIRGDYPFERLSVGAGEHECHCNAWGAVSIQLENGKLLGVKPREFTPITWRPNN